MRECRNSQNLKRGIGNWENQMIDLSHPLAVLAKRML